MRVIGLVGIIISKLNLKFYILCILTSIMVLHIGQNMLFLVFHMKNIKKEEKEGK